MIGGHVCLCSVLAVVGLMAVAVDGFAKIPQRSCFVPSFSTALHSDARIVEHEDYLEIYAEPEPDPEFAAIAPGGTVAVQVGDVDMARKAWKKRRRSMSPLLVPASVLEIERETMLSQNIQYLLFKFGQPLSETHVASERPSGYNSKSLCMSLGSLTSFYRRYLRSSLNKHATALGFESTRRLIESLDLPKIELYEMDGEHLWLISHIGRFKGRQRAAKTGLLEFVTTKEDQGIMVHTGRTRVRTERGIDEDGDYHATFSHVPLGAALRVNQHAVDDGIIGQGSIMEAEVMAFDPKGDAGSPLLKVGLKSEMMASRDKHRQNRRQRQRIAGPSISEPPVHFKQMKYELKELKPGDGPFEGKIVRVSRRAQAAFVDVGVCRNSDKKVPTRVLGMLRFSDLPVNFSPNVLDEEMGSMEQASSEIANDIVFQDELEEIVQGNGEIEARAEDEDNTEEFLVDADKLDSFVDDDEEYEIKEDITHLITKENGAYVYKDPESGETVSLGDQYFGEVEEDKQVRDEFSTEDDDDLDGYDSFTKIATSLMRNVNTDERGGRGFGQQAAHYAERKQEAQSENLFEDDDELEIENDGIAFEDEGVEMGHDSFLTDEADGLVLDGDDDLEFEDEDDPIAMEHEEMLEHESEEFLQFTREAMVSEDELDGSRQPSLQERSVRLHEHQTERYSFGDRRRNQLKVGDEVRVYVQGVSRQSSLFIVTVNESVRKMKDVKKEKGAEKKLKRMLEKHGGYYNLMELKGAECDGVVKATSKTGDWVYVEPQYNGVPVGVAQLADDAIGELERGDEVRIRIDGIDESRGQLAMTVLDKLNE